MLITSLHQKNKAAPIKEQPVIYDLVIKLWNQIDIRKSVNSYHLAIDTALAIANPEITADTPCCTPAILAQPCLKCIIITNNAYAMASF